MSDSNNGMGDMTNARKILVGKTLKPFGDEGIDGNDIKTDHRKTV